MDKILFINPPSPDNTLVIRDAHRCGRKSKEGMVWAQTNLAQLASVVQPYFIPKIYDCIADNISYPQLEKIIKEENPTWVVFEIIPATLNNDVITARIAKDLGIKTIAIGAHASSVPKQLIHDYSFIDYVIYGESEDTLVQIITGNKDGYGYRQQGMTGNTMTDRPFIDLNTLPIPRYDLLPLNKYTMPFLGRYIFIIASRGCPFNCIFCRENLIFKRKYRAKSPKLIMAEIDYLKNYKIDTFLFHSGDFTTNKEWVMDFCEKIAPKKVRWACNTHIKTIDREMTRAMKDAGCVMIAPGIESGSQTILNNIRKETNIPMIIEKVTMMASEGIEVWGYFVFGLPGETKETMILTMELACELPLSIAHFGFATPYYGTDFYKMAVDNNWLRVSSWEDYDQNQSISIEYPDLKKKDISEGIRNAYLQFYLRPRPLMKLVKAGLKTDVRVLTRLVKGWL